MATMIDPVKKVEQFKADLAAMAVGQTKDGHPQQRMADKNFGLLEYKFNRWSAELDESQTLDDALESSFWVHQVAKIMGHDKTAPKGMLDIIEVRKRDIGLYAELLITEIGSGYMRLKVIARVQSEAVEIPDDVPFTTRWNVGKRRHEVLRRADKVVMSGDFQTKESAVAWIKTHMSATAAA